MSVVIVKRPPRVLPPDVPTDEVRLEPPPELARPEDQNLMMSLLPMLGMGTSSAFFFTSGQSIMKIMGGVMIVSTLAMALAQLVKARQGGGAEMAQERQDYLKYLTQVRRDVRTTARMQRDGQYFLHPNPEQLWALVAEGRRVWERRSSDSDFTQVRLGLGPQQLSTPLMAPETAPLDELEPLTAHAMKSFLETHGTLDALPLAVSLRSFYHVSVSGDPDTTYGAARAMISQLCTLHSPEDLRVAVVASPGAMAEWEWTKWLPHVQHSSNDGAGSQRVIVGDLGEVEELLADELEGRGRFNPQGTPVVDQPHLVVVMDGGGIPDDSLIAGAEGLQGVTIIEVVPGIVEELRGSLSVQVQPGELLLESQGGTQYTGTCDTLSLTEAEALARQLAPLRAGSADGDEPLLANLDFTELMGIGDAGSVDVARTWRPRTLHERLRVPLGVDRDGQPVMLDIKEASQEGMGPHGLCVGATGSGKSEVLRTLVLALTVTHSSETLNFILADFKGGATFAGMSELPHVAAVITNLADDLTLIDRMRDSITGELQRRQELLRSAGNYANITDYEKARAAGAPLDPLPSLVMVLDEFSELLTARPDFIEMFIQIGRIGRSMGVHMLLASQRLEEGKLRGLDTFLSYRIGLRTFSAAESRTAIGVPDAYHLPNVPGSGILKYDTETMIQFKAAYVGGVYRAGGGGGGGSRTHRQPVLFTAAPVAEQIIHEPEPEVVPDQVDDALADTVLDVIVARIVGQGPPAHQVWLPPLEESPSVDSLLPPLSTTPERGLHAADYPALGKLVVPMALVDKPFEQRRDIQYLDFSGSAGHGLVVGGPQSGKSTLIRSIMTSFALTHTPSEVQFYCLDFGGGGMLAMEGLPHVGGAASRLDSEKVRRTVAEVRGILNEREEFFRANNVDSIGTFRSRRAAGQYPDQRWGDVFLIIDGWAAFKTDYEQLDPVILDLASRGLGFGVHLIIGSGRYTEVRPALRDQLLNRVELKLGDPMESEFDRKKMEAVPLGMPGRGLTPDKLSSLGALPRIDASSEVETLGQAIEHMVTTVSEHWQGPPAPPVRMLPTKLHISEVPKGNDFPERGVAIGVDETTLSPSFIDFETDPLMVVYGESESGKSAFLRMIAKQISERYATDKALIVAGDYRRAHLSELPESHLYKYCASGPQLQEVVTGLAGSMGRRMPGPDVTPEQLRNRSWYDLPDAFVIVDDYDLVATSSGNPLQSLLEYLPFARDLGLRIIIARSSSGAARSSFEPVMQRMKELGATGLVLSGDPAEGQIFGPLKPQKLPPGRGMLVTRKGGAQLVQTAWMPMRSN
ncbi:type VII secretion protein EccCa [Streptomyces sp. NPDC059897]|uniref:type VII secretion protein EccCa n=1 Tax=Streptomyces sp. NPDC059897 TaxID=3346994 RepID=UPI00365F285C